MEPNNQILVKSIITSTCGLRVAIEVGNSSTRLANNDSGGDLTTIILSTP